MNKTETVLLCRYIKAMCPAQLIDEYTPDAWSDVLDDISLEDAKKAVQTGIKWGGWHFVDIAEVINSVNSTRGQRLDEFYRQFGPLIPPMELDDDFDGYQKWIFEATRRIRAGEVTEPAQLGMTPEAQAAALAEAPRTRLTNPVPLRAAVAELNIEEAGP